MRRRKRLPGAGDELSVVPSLVRVCDVANGCQEGDQGRARRFRMAHVPTGAQAFVGGTETIGLLSSVARRDIDFAMQQKYWRSEAVHASADAKSAILRALERVSGPPEAEASVAGALTRLQSAIMALRSNPASTVGQTEVVALAREFAAQLNGFSDAIQRERNTAHSRMVALVQEANSALAEIGRLNNVIVRATQAGQTTAELEDKRDAAIRVVARALDARPIEGKDGAVTLVNGLAPPPVLGLRDLGRAVGGGDGAKG